MPSIPKAQMVTMAVMMGWRYLEIDVSEGTAELNYLRIMYASSMAVCLCAYGLLYTRVAGMANDGQTVKVTFKEPMKPTVVEEITVAEHDWRELKKLLTQSGIGMALIPFLHIKWAYTIPLVVQSINVPVTLFTHKFAQVHLLGNAAVGSMARPWKAPPSPFEGLTKLVGGEEPAEDAAIDDTKKKGKKKRS